MDETGSLNIFQQYASKLDTSQLPETTLWVGHPGGSVRIPTYMLIIEDLGIRLNNQLSFFRIVFTFKLYQCSFVSDVIIVCECANSHCWIHYPVGFRSSSTSYPMTILHML